MTRRRQGVIPSPHFSQHSDSLAKIPWLRGLPSVKQNRCIRFCISDAPTVICNICWSLLIIAYELMTLVQSTGSFFRHVDQELTQLLSEAQVMHRSSFANRGRCMMTGAGIITNSSVYILRGEEQSWSAVSKWQRV